MDLLQYLIAPHEQNRHQIPGIRAPTTTQDQQRYLAPNRPEASRYPVQDRGLSAVRTVRNPYQVPVQPVGVSHFSTQQSPALGRIEDQSPIHPEVLRFLTQRRPVSTGATNHSHSQAQPVHTHSVHPDVLEFLSRPVSALAGVTSHAIDSDVTDHLPGRVQHSVPSFSRVEVEYLSPRVVSPLLEERNNTSTVYDTKVKKLSDQTSLVRKSPPVMYASHESSIAPNLNKICFWWYHFGDCTRDPNSPTFNGTNNICRFFHFIDAGMENVCMQKVPAKMHRDMGDCQLPRCCWSSTYDMHQYKESVTEKKASAPSASVEFASTDVKKINGVTGDFTQKKALMPTHQLSPTSPSTEKAVQTHKKTRRSKRSSNKTTPATAQTPTLPTLTGKRKASEISTKPTQNLPEKKKKKKQKKKKQKRNRPTTPSNLLEKIPPSPPPIEQKLFSAITATEPEPLSKTAIPTTRKRTCFYWYHGCCSYPGKKCTMLHALTNPPTFVQPPQDYVHRDECFRAWCPGDYMWDHETEEYWHGQDSEAKLGLKDDVEIQSAEEAEMGKAEDDDDDEWFVTGLP